MASLADYKLFTPLALGKGLTLKNLIVYGPTTRARADIETPADAGLIITEGCAISEQAYGWWGAPAQYNDAQQAAWKTLVDRVHTKGGKIFLQLWHMSRQAHSSLTNTNEIVSVSVVKYEKGTTRDANGNHVGYETPRALKTKEVSEVVDEYRKCTVRAKAAGFDGVEVHGANGYLVDQFLQSCINNRTDKYGGSFENRYRFLHEVVMALKTAFPADHIGVRPTPNGVAGSMGSEDNYKMFSYAFERLSEHGLAYLALLDGFFISMNASSKLVTVFDAKKLFKGVVIANSALTRDVAEGVLRSGAADLVGFVRLYMANPDLAERFRNDWPLNPEVEYDFYWDAHNGDEGYNASLVYSEEGKKQEKPQS